MRVLHLLKSNKYSGAENVVLTIMDACPDIEMIYASMDGPIRKVVEDRGHRFYPLEETSVRMIKKAVGELQPDIIHAHDFTMASTATWAAGDIPVIAHLHNNPPWLKKIGVKSIVFALALPKIRQVISVSKAVEDEYVFRGLMRNKNTVIGNVVDTKSVQQKARESCDCKPVDMVFLGRMTPQKSPILFCQIVESVKKSLPETTARMIGDGELMPQIKEYIHNHKLDDTIELVGFQSNPYPYLNAGKVMVMPSAWEGFGLVAIEAMCLGKPVICSGVGGLADIVDSCCGAKCKEKYTYVNEITAILNDDIKYDMKAKAACEKAQKYCDLQAYKNAVMKVYRNTITEII